MIVKISAIIEAYLQRENRLIIPSVGTLLKRKESGEIVFVEMLKKNDGKLVGLVAEQFGVAADEAEAIVEGYSEEIGRQIATSRKFIIDGVGVLLVGANGALDFAFNPFTRTIPGTVLNPDGGHRQPSSWPLSGHRRLHGRRKDLHSPPAADRQRTNRSQGKSVRL